MKYFNKYLDWNFYELEAEQINLCSVQETGTSIGNTATEIKKFIGIYIALSSFKHPGYHMYYSSWTRVPLIIDILNFNRFCRVQNFFHLVDKKAKDHEWEPESVVKAAACRLLILAKNWEYHTFWTHFSWWKNGSSKWSFKYKAAHTWQTNLMRYKDLHGLEKQRRNPDL